MNVRDALSRGTAPMELDRRRQPAQPPARLFGVIPASFFAPNQPPNTIAAPDEGILVDPYLSSSP
jgi:hypothetical protein